MEILEIRILPPFAVGRLGSSPEPMDNYRLVVEDGAAAVRPKSPHYQAISTLVTATLSPGSTVVVGETQPVTRAQQIGIFADACNRCGNCDVTCPETGGPFARKANVFGSLASLDDAPDRDGLAIERTATGLRSHVRDNGERFTIDDDGARLVCQGDGLDLSIDPAAPEAVSGTADRPADIGRMILLARIARAVTAPTIVTYANAAFD